MPSIDGWIQDGAGGHKGADMRTVDAPRVVQPPYAPWPDPVERQAWQADPARVRLELGPGGPDQPAC